MPRSLDTEREPFVSNKVSPSRIEALLQCGVQFRMKYIDGMPPQRSGSAALFGIVMHKALEGWTPNRSADLLTLVRSGWLSETEGTSVKDFIGQYQRLSVQAIRKEHEIREAWKAKGKESKAPRMTKEWKGSEIATAVDDLMRVWLPRLQGESPWRFNDRKQADGKVSAELPTLYDESLVLARRYQARYQHLPPTLFTEFAFDVEWRGFRLNGHIDAIEPLLDKTTGEALYLGITDYKTYKKQPAELKDWRQMVMYRAAVDDLIERGAIVLPDGLAQLPIKVGIDYLRWQEADDWAEVDAPGRRYWDVGADDLVRLHQELSMYQRQVDSGNFLPAAKGSNPDFCDYPDNCCLRNTSAAGGCFERVKVAL